MSTDVQRPRGLEREGITEDGGPAVDDAEAPTPSLT